MAKEKQMQMIMEEARRYMADARAISPKKPVPAKLVKLSLKETGEYYPAENSIATRYVLEDFCRQLSEDSAMEVFSVIACNASCRVISVYQIAGSLSEVSAYPRNVAAFALLSNAHSVFLTHNHPGGTPTPSAEDIKSTALIKKALAMFGIGLLDHMIIAPGEQGYSMAQHGDL